MRPGTGSGVVPNFVLEQRIRQLQRKLRAKEERIIVLETENALLNLKLVQIQGTIKNSSAENYFGYYKKKKFCETTKSTVIQFHKAIQGLKEDMQHLHASVLQFANDVLHQGKSFLHQMLFAVQRQELHNEAVKTFQIKTLEMEQSLHEVKEKYEKEKQRRILLHNSLIELKGNIRVHCRIRPLLPFDAAPKESVLSQDRQRSISEKVVWATDHETILVKCNRPGYSLINKTYQFERVYSTSDSQGTVFEDLSPLLTSLLDGYNVCIMAYGQTGSGKTYTMLGPQPEDNFHFPVEDEPELGIIPRASKELFRLLSEETPGSHWVEVSVVEIYNNEVFDLLAKNNAGRLGGIKREIITNKEGKSDIPLLIYELVEDAMALLKVINQGLQLRVRHPTLVHTDSSRSHLVITLMITIKTVSEDNFALHWAGDCSSQQLSKEHLSTSCSSRASLPTHLSSESVERLKPTRTKLQLVDLAGSECVGMSGVTGSVLKETSFINRSLSALADVLGAIAEQHSHVPYRNSKLTHFLQDSIGGDAKLLVMMCISPSQKYITESLQTLGFGSRAQQIHRGHAKKRNQSRLSRSK